MKLKFQYGTKEIEFEVEYGKRKNMEILIEPPDSIYVKAPAGTSEGIIIDKVRKKADWIIQKIYYFKHMQYQPLQKEYVNGEAFMYLGRNYSLQIELDPSTRKPEVKLYRGKFLVKAQSKDEETIKKAMEQWYREKAKEVIDARIKYYQRFFKIHPSAVKIKEQKKRWGSCTSMNELLFNWRSVMAKSYALDYIIVHEMCHMYHKDHSKEFWDMVASVLPDYEGRKEWLRNYGVRMDL